MRVSLPLAFARRAKPGLLAHLACGLLAASGPALAGSPAHAAFDPDEDRAVRITSETGFGILGGTAGAFGGAFTTGLMCVAFESSDSGFGCFGAAIIGGLAGEFFGIWLGSWAGGQLAGGNGGLGWTLLGTASGALVTGVIIAAAEIDVGDLGWWIFTSVLPLAGSIVGYELSTTREGPRTIGGSLTFLF